MSTVDPAGPTVMVTPESTRAGGVSGLVAAAVLVVALGASFVVARLMPQLLLADLAAKIIVVFAAVGLSESVERAIQQPLESKASARTGIVAAVVVVLALIAGIAGSVGCLRLSPALGDRGTLGLGFFVGGLWLAGLSMGTLLVRAFGSRGSLQARITRHLVLGFALAAVGSVTGARLGARGLELLNERAPALFAVWSPYRERALELIGLQGVWVLVTILLVALPLASSGCRILVRQTFAGISALESASEAVAAGRLELRVEHEASSREVRNLVRSYNDMLQSLARGRALERAFVPRSESALSRLRRHFQTALLAPEQRPVTIVVAEVRDLVELTENTAPSRLIALLDRFFASMVAAIDKYEGHVERFDATGFIAIFNAPLEQTDHMVRATRCAIECQTELVAMNRTDEVTLAGKFSLAIGVASGPVVTGTIEGNGHARYVMLGETLDLAARLANLTPSGQVWVNQRNAETLPMYIPSVMLAAISMRGRAHPVAPYRVWPPP
jgi:class 3 adenylate cyclase